MMTPLCKSRVFKTKSISWGNRIDIRDLSGGEYSLAPEIAIDTYCTKDANGFACQAQNSKKFFGLTRNLAFGERGTFL
jgi:hypothetical protein